MHRCSVPGFERLRVLAQQVREPARRPRQPPHQLGDLGLDLNLLVALDALLGERNVTRAARRLHLSQPALSVQL